MHYYVQFEACSLIFLVVIAVRFFGMRRFPNVQNKLFGLVLWFAMLDITLDIVGSYTMEYAAVVPVWVNYVINTAFYALQILFPALMTVYAFILTGRPIRHDRGPILLSVPVLFFLLVLAINPFTGQVFSVPLIDGSHVFVHGPLFPFLYCGTAFYIAATLILLLKWRKDIEPRQFSSILSFLVIIVVAVVIQYFYPAYLLTGVAIALSIQVIFFMMQNPEDLLDRISGVFNYTAMMGFLQDRLSRRRHLWLVAADIGGIRRINSSFGVAVGNEVFEELGKYLNGFTGELWVFRMIGARFLIVTETPEEYRRVMDDIEERFLEPWHVRELDLMLSVTIRHFGEWDFFHSPEDVINLIDLAYADVGSEGWGTKKRISTDLLLQAERRMLVENAIRDSLKDGRGFSLHYQPIYSPAEGRFSGAEALLRLTSPTLGRISPAEFIPVAEKTGLITAIDELVIRMACQFYIRNERDLRGLLTLLELNLSAAEFNRNPGARLHGLVRDCGMSPDIICFEVTETAAVSHKGVLSDFMRSMRALGYRFALDDFGTGYANITRITELPFDSVKLDRSLLLQEDERSRRLFSGLMDMLSGIGLSTVVEGVETEEQARRAIECSATAIQGFHYASPMPEEEFIDFMRKQHI